VPPSYRLPHLLLDNRSQLASTQGNIGPHYDSGPTAANGYENAALRGKVKKSHAGRVPATLPAVNGYLDSNGRADVPVAFGPWAFGSPQNLFLMEAPGLP